MKKTNIILGAFLFIASTAHAVVFDAYKDDLETDLLCSSYPKTNLAMHLQLLKETGVIPVNSKIGPKNKLSSFKVNPGFQVFGFPLLAVEMVPAQSTNLGPTLMAIVGAQPNVVGNSLKAKASKYMNAQLMEASGVFSWVNEKNSSELTIAKSTKAAGTSISCSPFEP